MASVVVNGDTSGAVTLSAPAVAGTVTVTLPAASGTMLTTASSTGISGSAISSGTVAEAYGGTGTTTGYYGFKNRIINGAMVIDQRNAGASVTPTSGAFITDRWRYGATQSSKITSQQSTTAPTGFINSLLVTSSSAYSISSGDVFGLTQPIEGLNVSDFGWGTASASTVTLSFWVRSSLTGTFSIVLKNSANNRSYPASYTISSANTWEQKTITIAGDTSGTWLTTNGLGIQVLFSLGAGSTYTTTSGSWVGSDIWGVTGTTSVVGTNGATFYITGVQLEKGSTATSFDYRPYGTELQLCQRYFETLTSVGGSSAYVNFLNGGANATTQARFVYNYQVQKRSYPSVTFTTASGFSTQTGADALTTCTALVAEHLGINACQVTTTVASGLTAGATSRLIANNVNTAVISCSAEL